MAQTVGSATRFPQHTANSFVPSDDVGRGKHMENKAYQAHAVYLGFGSPHVPQRGISKRMPSPQLAHRNSQMAGSRP
jgi:hypothetical protein